MEQHHQQQQKWRISIDAKARNFVFKVKATASTSFQALSLHKFSVIFMLYHFKLKVELDSPRKSLVSRFLGLFERIPNHRRRPSMKTEIEAKKLPMLLSPINKDVLKHVTREEAVRACCLLIGILVCVIGTICGMDLKGIRRFFQLW